MDPTGENYIFLNAEQMSKDMEKNTKLHWSFWALEQKLMCLRVLWALLSQTRTRKTHSQHLSPKMPRRLEYFVPQIYFPENWHLEAQKVLIFIYCRCFSFWKTGHLQVPAVCFRGCFPSKNARRLLYHFYTVVRCRHTTGHVKVNFPHGRCKIPPANVLWFLGEFLTWEKMLPSLNLTYSLKMGRSPKGKETCDTTCDRIIGMVVGLFVWGMWF